LYNKEL
jgi:hypothetical protein